MKVLKKIWSLLLTMFMVGSLAFNQTSAEGPISEEGEGADCHRLVTPKLAACDIVDCKIGLWAYRKTGLRLEVEPVGPKLIVHDYGHGASSFWLSWGCADVAVDLMRDELRRLKRQSTKKIAVIGAGAVGLTTAYILLSKGYRVTIYARDTTPDTTSDVTPGVLAGNFHVMAGNKFGDQERFDEARIRSLAKFQELVITPDPEIKGVVSANVYCFDIAKEAINYDGLKAEGGVLKPVTINFDTGIQRKALVYKDIFIDRAVYMQDLLEKIHAMGAVIKRQTMNNMDDLLALPEKVVCNCMGLGAVAVLNDQDVVPLKGYAVTVNPSEGANYVLHAQLAGLASGDFISYQQLGDRGIVLGTLTEGDWNDFVLQEPVDALMNKLRKFMAFPRGTLHYPA